jgi:hypothetical protein
MRPNTGFSLQWIHGVPYLLPFGQNIADHRRGIRINETGAFIWEALGPGQTKEELLAALLSHYEIPAAQQPEISRDLEEFLSRLIGLGIVVPEDTDSTVQKDLQIGGLHLRLCGPEAGFSPDFAPFVIEEPGERTADCTVFVHSHAPAAPENGTLLLRSRELFVFDGGTAYRLLFPGADRILEARMQKDGALAHFYVQPPFRGTLPEDLFHAIRLAFLYLAQLRGQFVLHSASILYNGKAWLFSGPSGMGKSTHTNLWKSRYQTPILNGDLNLLALTPQGAVVHGLPWCGTSRLATTETYPLGGIILLGRAETDRIEALSDDKKALLVMQRLISPSWTAEQLAANLAFTTALTAQVPVCRFPCTKSDAAVEAIREWMDSI